MSRRKKREKPGVAAAREMARRQKLAEEGRLGKRRRRSVAAPAGWLFSKQPVFRFVVLFGLVMAVYYAVSTTPLFSQQLGPGHLRLSAAVSSKVLNLFGEDATREGLSVISSRYSVSIRRGCDAIEPSMLLIAAILAFPVSFRAKLPGILIGVLSVQGLNIVRIVSLYYTGAFFPRSFDMMHIEVWQPVFILLVLLLWVVWVFWALRGIRAEQEDPA